MTRRNPRAKWVLPQIVHPATSKCFKIEVPDEPYYIAAFRGALLSLASGVQWQDDPTHKAREVALVWRKIYFNVTNCQGELQFVDEWEDELSICESLRWNNGVLEGFCCGEWVPISGGSGGVIPGPTVQPNGTSRPDIGQTKCYNVVLSANNQWQLPFAVQPGDILTISAIEGTWNDGTATWYKADGTTAIFGVSTGGGQHHDGGDPDGTAYHMQLRAFTDTQTFAVTTGTPITIGGTGSQQVTLAANDGTLNDNSGSIAFSVCLENGGTPPVSTWCYVLDFRASDYGFTPYNGVGGYRGTYVFGSGWSYGPAANGLIQVLSPIVASTQFTECTVVLTTPLNGPDHTVDIEVNGPGGTPHLVVDNVNTVIDVPISPAVTGTQLFINVESDTTQPGGIVYGGYLQQIIMRGNGSNPFGTSNC